MFHHHISKLLYLFKWSQPDIQTSVSYIYTRVQNPHIDYMKKLIYTIKYLHITQWLPLTLESDDVLILKLWVDAFYGMRNDFEATLGIWYPLEKGFLIPNNLSRKLIQIAPPRLSLLVLMILFPWSYRPDISWRLKDVT